MDRVFLDANVIFSAAYRPDSGLAVLWRRAGATLLTSAYAVDEARRNLPGPDQHRRLDALVGACEIVPSPAVTGLPEGLVLSPDDEIIFLAGNLADLSERCEHVRRLGAAVASEIEVAGRHRA